MNIGKVRPQIFTGVCLLAAIAGFLIYTGAFEAAGGISGTIGLLIMKIIESDGEKD